MKNIIYFIMFRIPYLMTVGMCSYDIVQFNIYNVQLNLMKLNSTKMAFQKLSMEFPRTENIRRFEESYFKELSFALN